MRKPRDYDAELKALDDKAKQLRQRKVQQLGDLLVATGADGLPIEQLAGTLLAAVETADAATKEGWSKRGAAFFQSTSGSAARRNSGGARGASAGDSGTESSAGGTSAK
ncbi:conjugal transfer protein TraD [Sphingomonas sp.]|uniref:conjugal transfer protein TraD n=1 Tax=Sphingomonas sp. TaxID=28214 RepID=UPI0025DFA7DC|nr:conjugal transfer protein TraD [Sphingomonas sp.]